MTQVTIDDVSGFEGLLQQSVSQAKADVRVKLAQAISPTEIVGLDDVFEEILHHLRLHLNRSSISKLVLV